VLCPDLVVADWAYPPEQIRTSEPARLVSSIFARYGIIEWVWDGD